MDKKHMYEYAGPVMEFDTCIDCNWKASTYATSEKKARNNLAYRYKMDHNRAPNAKIVLTGKLTMVKEGN